WRVGLRRQARSSPSVPRRGAQLARRGSPRACLTGGNPQKRRPYAMLFFSRLRRPRATPPVQRPRRRAPALRPGLEILEDRCLLSVPSLSFSSYLPGAAYAVAVDGAGEAFVAGTGGNGLAYVARLNASGTAPAYFAN